MEVIPIQTMFLEADPVVQGIMILLLLASLVSWAIMLEKFFLLRRTSRDIFHFKKSAAQMCQGVNCDSMPGFTAKILETGLMESKDGAGRESRADYRERVERAMRGILGSRLDRIGSRTIFLATVGASSPFIGLLGTVWGIMNSFIGIAASGETSLAVVAPGIAEALFATAMGLVAAIPAVLGYNKITATMKKITKEALGGIGLVGNHLAKIHFNKMEQGKVD